MLIRKKKILNRNIESNYKKYNRYCFGKKLTGGTEK